MSKFFSKIISWFSKNGENKNTTPLPNPIAYLALTYYLLALGFMVVVSAMCISMKDYMGLLYNFLAIILVGKGILYRYLWLNNMITETVILCTSVTMNLRGVHIVGHDTNNKYYDFYAPKKNSGSFIPDTVYVCYAIKNSPKSVIAFKPM